MAYDDMTNDQLIADTYEKANQLENMAQAVMRRVTELKARGCTCDHDHEEPVPTPTPEPAPTPSPTPTPTPDDGHNHEPPPPAGWVRADSIVPITSEIDVNDWLLDGPAHTTGEGAPDIVGAFRFVCNMSHLLYDDPIVYPGQPGAAHLHHFFGNTETNAHSTYEGLRRSGRSTVQGDTINRSAYWIPALLDGHGSAVTPDNIGIYYKRTPSNHPRRHGECRDLPAGLKMVFGRNYAADPVNPDAHPHDPVSYSLNRGDVVVLGNQPNLEQILEAAQPGDTIYARMHAPDAWDGTHADAPNHRAHLAYSYYERGTGRYRTPDTHPFVIPQLSLIIPYPVLEGDTPKDWRYSSDDAVQGGSLHGDYIEGWEPVIREAWHANAIERLLNCNSCDLGNGKMGKRWPGFTFAQRPHLVPVPLHP